jgi:hypothetical protein
MLSVIMLNVVILSVVAPNASTSKVIKLFFFVTDGGTN